MTAQKDETPLAGGVSREASQNTDSPDSATADAERIAKLRCTWPALAALAGYELRRLADGRWLVSRWNLSRELDETEVPGWLRQVGAAQ